VQHGSTASVDPGNGAELGAAGFAVATEPWGALVAPAVEAELPHPTSSKANDASEEVTKRLAQRFGPGLAEWVLGDTTRLEPPLLVVDSSTSLHCIAVS
jgi:hypothetical protein